MCPGPGLIPQAKVTLQTQRAACLASNIHGLKRISMTILPSHLLKGPIQISAPTDWIFSLIIHRGCRSVLKVLKLTFLWSLSKTQITLMRQTTDWPSALGMILHFFLIVVYNFLQSRCSLNYCILNLNKITLNFFSVKLKSTGISKMCRMSLSHPRTLWLEIPNAWHELQLMGHL